MLWYLSKQQSTTICGTAETPMEIVMPRLSESMTEGKILHWAVKPGDFVSVGDILGEVETDKANMELEATEPGYVVEILAPVGTLVPVGAPLLRLAESFDEVAAAECQHAATQTSEISEDVTNGQAQTENTASVAELPSPNVSPLAAELAAKLHVDLAYVDGTGPGGRVMKDDVLRYVQRAGSARFATTSQSSTHTGTIKLEDVVPNHVLETVQESGSETAFEPAARSGITSVNLEKHVDVRSLLAALSVMAERLNLLPRPSPHELLPPCVGRAFALALNDRKLAPESFSPSAVSGCIAVSVGPSKKRLYPTISNVCLLSVSELLRTFWEQREQALAGALKCADCHGAALVIESVLGSAVKVVSAQLSPESSPVVFLSSPSPELLEVHLAVRLAPHEVALWVEIMQAAGDLLESPLLLAEGELRESGK